MATVLASSHPERLLDEAGVLGGQFLAVDPGQEATHSGSLAPDLRGSSSRSKAIFTLP